MDCIAFRRASYEYGQASNYTICYICMITVIIPEYERNYQGNRWWARGLIWNNEVRFSIPPGWEVVHTNGLSIVCWCCHNKISRNEFPEITHSHNKKRWVSKRRTGSDTRRVSASGKLIGSKNNCRWCGSGNGKFCRRRLHKAQRSYDRLYAKSYICDPEFEQNISTRQIATLSSMVNWHDD